MPQRNNSSQQWSQEKVEFNKAFKEHFDARQTGETIGNGSSNDNVKYLQKASPHAEECVLSTKKSRQGNRTYPQGRWN